SRHHALTSGLRRRELDFWPHREKLHSSMPPVNISADYYQQFDADYARAVPAEGYGGWKTAEIELAPEHTALVVMHAWECGTMEQWPGWRRCVEYHPRALKILQEVFPPLLTAVR